jgi:hypothetical protein
MHRFRCGEALFVEMIQYAAPHKCNNDNATKARDKDGSTEAQPVKKVVGQLSSLFHKPI